MTSTTELERLSEVLANVTAQLATLVEMRPETMVMDPLTKGRINYLVTSLEKAASKVSGLVATAKTGSDENLDRAREDVKNRSEALKAAENKVETDRRTNRQDRKHLHSKEEELDRGLVALTKDRNEFQTHREETERDLKSLGRDVENSRIDLVARAQFFEIAHVENENTKKFLAEQVKAHENREAKLSAREKQFYDREEKVVTREKEVAGSGINKLVNDTRQRFRGVI